MAETSLRAKLQSLFSRTQSLLIFAGEIIADRAAFHLRSMCLHRPVICLCLILSCSPSVVEGSEQDLRIDTVHGNVYRVFQTESTLWINTVTRSRGGLDSDFLWELFSWKEGAGETPSRIVIDPPGIVYAIHQEGDTIWIGESMGLFLWEKNKTQAPKRLDVSTTGSVFAFHDDGTTLWIGTSKGLFRWQKGSVEPPKRVDINIGLITALHGKGKTLWIGGSEGLYRWETDSTEAPIHIDIETGMKRHLYIIRKGRAVPMANTVLTFHSGSSALWIGAGQGLFHWENDSAGAPQRLDDVDSVVQEIHQIRDTLWFAAEDKLFRWRIGTAENPERVDVDMGEIHAFEVTDSTLWVAADNGLFRWEYDQKGAPERVDLNTGTVSNLLTVSSTLWVSADNGLFRIDVPNNDWKAKITIVSELPSYVKTDDRLAIEWTVSNFAWRTTANLVRQRVVVYDDNRKKVDVGNSQIVKGKYLRGDYQYVLPQLAGGDYTLVVEATDLNGKISRSKELAFTVMSPSDLVLSIIERISLWYGAFTLIVFIFLVLASRRWQKPFEILTYPWIRRFTLYFGFALQHLSFVRIWVFERYYKNMKLRFGAEQKYVSVLIRHPSGISLFTTDMLRELRTNPHVCIVGEPGTGKTAMTRELMRIYFEMRTLRAAWKRFGFVPVWVSVREVMTRSMPELARAAIGSQGMFFDDEKFFSKLFRRGGFLLMLDGLNEGRLEEEVRDFSAMTPSVYMLITSQTPLSGSSIPHYELPQFRPPLTRRLLKEFLGDQAGIKSAREMGLGLRREIRSGYDVKLVVDLVSRNQNLPQNRLELYEFTARNAYQMRSRYPQHLVSSVAWALWKRGKRRFEPDDVLTSELLEPLLQAKLVVPRGEQYEFRHDQMRDYLAACWAACCVSSIEGTIARLEEEEIWDLSPVDQRNVFEFLTELVSTEDKMRLIAQFAADKLKQRVELAEAVRLTSKKMGWSIDVTVGRHRPGFV